MVAVIVSDSRIVLNALVRSIESSFETIRLFARIGEIDPSIDWSVAVTIYDSNRPAEDVEALLRSIPAAALPRVVVLPKETHELRDFAPLIGKVGAILPNSSGLEEIVLVARLMRTGLVVLPSTMMPLLQVPKVQTASEPLVASSLTDRELGVLTLLAGGSSNKVIGRELGINDTTVRVHVRSVLRKMGVHNRTQAALRLAEQGHYPDISRETNGRSTAPVTMVERNGKAFERAQ